MQKISSLLFALIACAGTMFASNTQVDDIWYDFDSSTQTASVTYKGSSSSSYYDRYSGSVSIPSSVTYSGVTYSVTSIGRDAFAVCTGLTSIEIPTSVISIGEWAFYNCSGLTSVEIPNSVTSIGGYAFSGCSGLTSVTIPNSVTSIGNSAFSRCSGLTSITIPNSVTSIGRDAFYKCSGLTSIEIPNSVTSIGEWAFAYCSDLTSVTIGNSVTSIGGWAFAYCSGLASVTNYATTPQTIYSSVFYYVDLSSCTLYVPEGSIGLYQAAEVWKDFGSIIGVDAPEGVDNIPSDKVQSTKILRDGQILILTGDKTYTLTGQEIR